MSFMKTNSVNITVDGTTYNSLTDFGLAIENTDYAGTPVLATDTLVQVPGREGLLDTADAVFGGAYFTKRVISISFGGVRNAEDWDSVISTFRNLFEGKTVKVEFATILGWYFTGRCVINAYKHRRALGTFLFQIPNADPYRYRDITITVPADSGSDPVTLTVTRKPVIPTFVTIDNAIVTYNDVTYPLDVGTHQISAIKLREGTHTLYVQCTSNVEILYKDGSL